MAEVIWLPEAVATLEAIRAYLSQFNATAAERIAADLVKAGDSLSEFPHRGRPAGDAFRELATVPPYVLRYIVVDATVYIARVKHGRQR